ncbi:glycosyltransferase family 39 protein [Neorhizobium alkalisoli]|jgi:4-amino-4-deoxy-L-arabinose transferase-like glycosyltransferase|uniref:Dolichyl-phosphate-mannose-protein mannosyltransferase n=1 Tax=Neorhizobium alkalisoli TaxID=528178 RepID=A0A561R2U9_9HYPH|nr:glycosyltransferase family 39 protein [Neorhizobium alkalisoli]TWF56944.1 dolichyl-phosphate-mannose-protein mannosyltransferase [Neorhizobium alkalisoli]
MKAIRRLRETLALRPEFVLWLIAAYYITAITFRVLRTEGLQNDEAEQLFLSQFLLTGYGRQPPLYNWIQHAVVTQLGPSILALSLVKNTLLFLACALYAMAARKIVTQKGLPAIAALGVIAVPTISILAQRDLTHAIATICAVAFFLYGFFGTLTRPSITTYALTGLAVGLGLISKYNFVIVPVAAALAILPEPDFRRRLYDVRMLVTVAVALVICLPHGLWLIENFRAATVGTINAMRDDATGNPIADRWSGLSDLVVSIIDTSFAPIAFYLVVFRGKMLTIIRAESVWTRVLGRTIIFSLLLVCLIAIIGIGASTMSQKWLSPFLMMMPLYLCLKLDAAGPIDRNATPHMAVPVFLMAFGFIIYLMLSTLLAPFTGSYPKDSLPSRAFLREVVEKQMGGDLPGYIISGDMALAGAARLELRDVPVIMPNLNEIEQEQLYRPEADGLVIWQPKGHDTTIPPWTAAFLSAHGIVAKPDAVRILDVPFIRSRGKATAPFAYLVLDRR